MSIGYVNKQIYLFIFYKSVVCVHMTWFGIEMKKEEEEEEEEEVIKIGFLNKDWSDRSGLFAKQMNNEWICPVRVTLIKMEDLSIKFSSCH